MRDGETAQTSQTDKDRGSLGDILSFCLRKTLPQGELRLSMQKRFIEQVKGSFCSCYDSEITKTRKIESSGSRNRENTSD